MVGGHRGGRLPHAPALDGLRGLAVAVVVAFHLGRLQGGFLGVDLFFVLSGFLITSLLVAGWRHEGRIDLRTFWTRRARRLMPALLVVVGAVAVYARWWASPLELHDLRGSGLATLGYVANWHQLLADVDYWDSIRAPSPLLHTWSLAIEEQFYLVWPLLVAGVVLVARRAAQVTRTLLVLTVVTAALAVASATALVVLHGDGDGPLRVYLGTDTRAAALLVGALVALVFAQRVRPLAPGTVRALDVIGVLALAGLAAAWVRTDGLDSWLYEGGLPACSAAAAVTIGAVWAAPAGLLARALSLAPLRHLGRISYGLYLWHWPVIVVANPLRTGIDGLALDALRVAMSLALAEVSFHLLEMPVRRGVLQGRPAWAAALGVPVLCTLALIAGTVARPSPFSREVQLASADPDTVIVGSEDPDVVPPTTDAAGTPASTPPDAPPRTILVVGDSGAYYLGKGMTAVGNQRGVAVYSRGIIGCTIGRVPGTYRRLDGQDIPTPAECGNVDDRWRFFLGLVHPDLVLLTLAFPGGGAQVDLGGGRWASECDPEHDLRLRSELTRELHLLGSTGARVATTTIPYKMVPYDPVSDRPSTDCRNAALREASARTGARLIDLAEWACPDMGTCDVERDGVVLRPDLLHFAGPGAEVAGAWLLDQLAEQA